MNASESAANPALATTLRFEEGDTSTQRLPMFSCSTLSCIPPADCSTTLTKVEPPEIHSARDVHVTPQTQLSSELKSTDDSGKKRGDKQAASFGGQPIPGVIVSPDPDSPSRQLTEPTDLNRSLSNAMDKSKSAMKLRRLAVRLTTKVDENGQKRSVAVPCCRCCLVRAATRPPRFRGLSSRSVIRSSTRLRERIPLSCRSRDRETPVSDAVDCSALQAYWMKKRAIEEKYQLLINSLKEEELCEMSHRTRKLLDRRSENVAQELDETLKDLREYYESTRDLIMRQELVEQEELVAKFRELLRLNAQADEE